MHEFILPQASKGSDTLHRDVIPILQGYYNAMAFRVYAPLIYWLSQAFLRDKDCCLFVWKYGNGISHTMLN